MSVSTGGKGGSPSAPDFGNISLAPGMMSTGSAIANRYAQLGLGDSTMETQDENANVQNWDTQQALLDANLQQMSFQDQLQSDQLASQEGGFSAGLGSFAGLL
jgi:hypothetical protein